jgi:hypothetical protein
VGSALGPGGLAARIAHHVRPVAKPHWHIDRLRRAAQVVAVWYTVGNTHLECLWAAALAGQAGAGRPIRGFGASDCRCPGHLIALPGPLDGRVLAAALGPSGELVTLEPDTKAPDVPSGRPAACLSEVTRPRNAAGW